MIPLHKVSMDDRATEEVSKALGSGYIGQGPKTELFESLLADLIGTNEIVSTNSCTSALHLAMYTIGLSYNDLVITTPLTCAATIWPMRANNLIPIWADIDPRTLNISTQSIRSIMSEKTRLLVIVHWGGYPVDLDEIQSICDEYYRTYNQKLFVIEDCAHAWGTRFNGQLLGNHGNFCTYSFGPVKPLTCGDGGCLVTPDPVWTNRAKKLRWYGIDRNDRDAPVKEWGFKFNMNDIAASIGIANLTLSQRVVMQQKMNAQYYDTQLKSIDGIKLLERKPLHESSFWLYTFLVQNRNDFIRAMKSRGIESGPVHKRIDEYDCISYRKRELPCLNSIYPHITCIPVGPWADVDYIVSQIRKGW